MDSSNDFDDLAYGCILGAFCGDALGSYLEFYPKVSESQVEEALKMEGGGMMKLGPGQITDDSELALCLGHGLVAGNGKLNLEEIAIKYKEWYLSNPFDIGITTKSALDRSRAVEKMIAPEIKASAKKWNGNSPSNGGLMRLTPLCVWGSRLSASEFEKAIREETTFTHVNPTAINASVAYGLIIHYLLNHKGDNEGAYKKCQEFIEKSGDLTLQSWMDEVNKGELPPANEKIGWAKIALLYTLYYVKQNKGYKEAMAELLRMGGDTDTNCCIVGGALGALHGRNKVPDNYVKKVLSFDPKLQGGRIRPSFLLASKCLENMIKEIIKIRPFKLEVVSS